MLVNIKLLDSFQRRVIGLINEPVFSAKLSTLSHSRTVWDLRPFYRYFQNLSPLFYHWELFLNKQGAQATHIVWQLILDKHRTVPSSWSTVLLNPERLDPEICCRKYNNFPSLPNRQSFKFHVIKFSQTFLSTPTVN